MKEGEWFGILEGPIHNFKKGDTLKLGPLCGPTSKEIGLKIFENLASVPAALALCSRIEGSDHIWGSAAMVAPGLALTAKHVLEEYESQKHFDGKGFLAAIAPQANGKLSVWLVYQYTKISRSDLAILAMELRTGTEPPLEIHVFEATTKSPSVGELVSTVGFVADKDKFSNKDGPSSLNLFFSCGEILDVFENGTGLSNPSPVVVADMQTRGGMSGGPVFNKLGKLIGVVSRGTDDYTVAALVREALVADVTPTWPDRMYATPTNLLKERVAFIEDRHRLSIVAGPDGISELQYQHFP